jgi:hypothetical protein
MDEALGERWLGSAVAEVVFEAGSLSAVAGVRLADGLPCRRWHGITMSRDCGPARTTGRET